jgi:hypothetical protein
MELFLNCLWALIGVFIMCLWRTRWMRQRRDGRREPLREWTAIACALVLLFFAVSLSDDLHAEVMLSDDCFTGRRHSSCMHASLHPAKSARTLASFVVTGIPAIESLSIVGRVANFQPLSVRFVYCNERPGRAPPLLSL